MIIYAYVTAPQLSYIFRTPNPSPRLLFRLRRTINGPSCTFNTLVYLWEDKTRPAGLMLDKMTPNS